jgi:hypothetical protein
VKLTPGRGELVERPVARLASRDEPVPSQVCEVPRSRGLR